ncbi:Spo11/DNA topoisomerase VI subunit A [Lipomyces arxii]|uniref:Spo11/DNA topoisomerase VI subunit A n=1 Tax=Lipomyces arxii TaxID=56418 RepID=UPI0034CFCA83
MSSNKPDLCAKGKQIAYAADSDGSKSRSIRDEVLQKIEDLIDTLLGNIDQLLLAELKLVSRRDPKAARFDSTTFQIVSSNVKNKNCSSVRFPGGTDIMSWRFAVLVRILDIITELVTSKQVTTKRDLYYRDVGLFKNQLTVDRMVDDIARTLGVQRLELGIVAAQKGLVCGTLCVSRTDDVMVVLDGDIQLIPSFDSISNVKLMDTDFVLVIEKEAVFRGLCDLKFYNRADIGRSVLVTGKGYPDMTTRHFLACIAKTYPLLPILGVVDSDPHGVEIFCTYKFGSRALAHESIHLTIASMKWIGVNLLDYNEGWTELTRRDRRKAISLLKQPYMSIDVNASLRSELQQMLFLNKKAEMNIVGSSADGIASYIARVVSTQL